jgi:hypothetical protein
MDRTWLTGDRAGPLGRKWRQLVGKVGELCVASRHLQGCSPRLTRLRTDVLAPTSKYWTYRSHAVVYGPNKRSSWSPTGAWLMPTTSLVGSGEKLGMDPWVGHPACCGLYRYPFFSSAVGSVQICQCLAKGCYMWTTWDTYGHGPYADWAWKACGVLVGFSPAGCTSTWTMRPNG